MDISVDIPMKTANIPQWKAGFLADGRYSVIIDGGIIRLLITTSVIIIYHQEENTGPNCNGM